MGHEFEAWFRSSEDYNDQRSSDFILCPKCGSHKVEKAIMSPNIGAGQRSADSTGQDVDLAAAPVFASPVKDLHGLNLSAPNEMVETFRQYRKLITENADNVGEKFAEEARKIHYDETPDRGIYGIATPDEVKELLEEGVDVAPLPVLPEDNN